MDIEKLKALVSMKPPRKNWDDFDPMDDSGGNFNDCFAQGVEEGRRELAAQIRALLESSEGA